jgi:Ca-activated chloride channel family protein
MEPIRTTPSPPRGRIALAAALLILTAAGGLAARQAAHATPTPSPPIEPGTLLLPPASNDALSFRGRLDRGAVHVGGDGLVHLELVAKGAELAERLSLRRPTDVIVVLDRSGSMGGDPLAKAVAAVGELIGQLGGADRFALVTYSNQAEQVLALESATPAARSRWLSRVASIGAGGGTNMSAGLDRAHHLLEQSRQAGRVARIVLLSDGHANQGDATPEGLSRRAGRAIHGEYVLSTVGVGEGFDERLMTRLADAGTGNFYYVPDVEVLAGIFADEFASARETVASALEIRIDTPGGVHVVDAAGYPLARESGYTAFRPGSLFAGQERTLWVTLRVPANEAGSIPLGDVRLHYTDAAGKRGVAELDELPRIAAVVDHQEFAERLDADAVKDRFGVDLMNRVRQGVASSISGGDYAHAYRSLEQVDFQELEALGYVADETEAYEQIQQLRREVDRAASAPAEAQPALRSQLGKQLYEEGTDGRRKGSKR